MVSNEKREDMNKPGARTLVRTKYTYVATSNLEKKNIFAGFEPGTAFVESISFVS